MKSFRGIQAVIVGLGITSPDDYTPSRPVRASQRVGVSALRGDATARVSPNLPAALTLTLSRRERGSA